ncbi:hypothetical protein BC827DRAFT_1185154 [Russula dissimulans]|nr:hypothetical protein BC827DRAFT_1185154 [Russula dissimulans]
MDSLKGVLERIRSSASFEHVSHLGTSLALRLEVAYTKNRGSCLSFLQGCVEYAEIMTCLTHIAGPVSSHAESESLHDLRECVMRSQFETTNISAESAVHARGSREFKASYEKALCLQQKTTLGLKILFESVSAHVAVTDVIPNDVHPSVVTLQELDELSYADCIIAQLRWT